MASRLRRTSSWQEAQANVRRAKEFAERYGCDEANPSEYIITPPADQAVFDDLLSQIK